MKRSLALNSLLLSTGMLNTTAQPAEFASADCVTGLNEIGLISVNNVSGSLQDVERVIALKADEQGASGIASSECRKINRLTTGGCRPSCTPDPLKKPPKSGGFFYSPYIH